MKLGEYELFEPIASGGMAEVYRGRAIGAEGFEKTVVIKRILPHFASDDRMVQMLVQEARIHAALAHRNIVQIHDLGQTDDGEYFIVLEYVDGHDLGAVIEALARMTPEPQRMRDALALHIVSELAEGVHFAHEVNGPDGKPAGLVHRDISPSNVLVSYSGEVKLSDFGLAKRQTDNSVIGTLKGKLAYMSPEQAKRWQLDRRSDIFSMGAVLFELLTGKRLRQIVDETDGFRLVASGVMTAPRSARPDLPIALEQLLTRALAPNPQDRFATSQQFAIACRACIHELPRDPAGETGELAGLLYRLLPKGAPRPSTEPSRVIRLHSQFFDGSQAEPAPAAARKFTPPPPIPNAARRPTPAPPASDPLSSTQPLRPRRTSTLTGAPLAPAVPHFSAQPAVLAPEAVSGEIDVDLTDMPARAAAPIRKPVPLPGMSAPRRFSPTPPPPAAVATAPPPSAPVATPASGSGPRSGPRPPSGAFPVVSDVRAGNLGGGVQAVPGIDGIMRDMLKQTVEAPHAAPLTAREIPNLAHRGGPAAPPPVAPAPRVVTAPMTAPAISLPMQPSDSTPRLATPSAVTHAPVRLKKQGGGLWKGLFFICLLLATAAGAAHVFVAPMSVLVSWFTPARLVVRTRPDGASVSLDGVRLVGLTPTATDVVRDRRDHIIEVVKDGYVTARSIVRFDQTVQLSEEITLQKMNGPTSTRLPDTEPVVVEVPDAGQAALEVESEPETTETADRDTDSPVVEPVARQDTAPLKKRRKLVDRRSRGRR